jgi:hypothetical protein
MWRVMENPLWQPYSREHHVLIYRRRQRDEEPQAGSEPRF